MKNRIIALGLATANIVMVGGLIASAIAGSSAQAQGTNSAGVAKPKKSVACPSGWSSTKNNETDTSMCFPQVSSSPKIYGKKESDSCASGYFEVYGVWCSTKRP